MNKKTMSYHLTPSERAIMDILWHEKIFYVSVCYH